MNAQMLQQCGQDLQRFKTDRMLALRWGSRHKVTPLTKELFAIDTFWEKENKQANKPTRQSVFSTRVSLILHTPYSKAYSRAYPMPKSSHNTTQNQILSYCVCDFCLGFGIFFSFIGFLFLFSFVCLFWFSFAVFVIFLWVVILRKRKNIKSEWVRRWDRAGRSWGEENSDQDMLWKTFLNIFK